MLPTIAGIAAARDELIEEAIRIIREPLTFSGEALGIRESSRKLNTALQAWQQRAATAEQEENGWESFAPNYDEIMEYAKALLAEADLETAEVSLIDPALELSEEREDLADFVKRPTTRSRHRRFDVYPDRHVKRCDGRFVIR